MSEWVERRLDAVADRVAIKNSRGYDHVLTVSAEHGLVDQEKYFNKRVASANLSGYSVVEPGDFVYNKSTSKDAPWGVVARFYGDAPAVVTSLYIVFRARKDVVDPAFLLLACNGSTFFDSLRGTLREGARSHGLLNVRLGEFFGAVVMLPTLPEQRRIIDVMAAVDAQIEALAEEIERLGRVYQAFLADLCNSYDFASIESVVDKAYAGGTPSRGRTDFYGGEIPWVKSGEVENDRLETSDEFITQEGLAGSSAKFVPPGATVVAMYGQGDTKGKAGFVVSPVTTNQAVLALIPDGGIVLPRYLLHAVRSQTNELRNRAIGAAQPNLSKGLVLSHRIPVPPSMEEQQTVARGADAMRTMRHESSVELARLRMFRSVLLTSLLNQDIEMPDSYDTVLDSVGAS